MAFKLKGEPMARNYGAPFTKPEGEDHSDEAHSNTRGHHDSVKGKTPSKADRNRKEMQAIQSGNSYEYEMEQEAELNPRAEREYRLSKGSGKSGPNEH